MKIPDVLKRHLLPLRFAPLESFDPDNISCEEQSDPAVMTMSPVVSVCVVTYNQAEYIRECLDSILAQKTDFPFEVVIGEDCSSDATRKIVEAYREKHPEQIRLLYSDANVGANMNSMRVIARCRGKYIAACDGDDFWHRRDKLQIQFEYMEKHPECAAVYGDYDILYEEYGKTRHHLLRRRTRVAAEVTYTLQDWFACRQKPHTITCTSFAGNFHMDMANHELLCAKIGMTDLIWWWELSLRGSVTILPESLATYRNNLPGRSLTQNTDLRKRLDFALDSILVSGCYFHQYNPDELTSFLRRRLLELLPIAIACRDQQYRKKFLQTLSWLNCSFTCREKFLIALWKHSVLFYPIYGAIIPMRRFRRWLAVRWGIRDRIQRFRRRVEGAKALGRTGFK